MLYAPTEWRGSSSVNKSGDEMCNSVSGVWLRLSSAELELVVTRPEYKSRDNVNVDAAFVITGKDGQELLKCEVSSLAAVGSWNEAAFAT